MKFFNLERISDYLNSLRQINIKFISTDDVINKSCFKKLKCLKNIEYASVLFKWMNENSSEDIIPMVEKFFPTKIGEIKEANHELKVLSFKYSSEDDKIHCCVLDNETERYFKIRTDLYEKRTKEYVEKEIADIKKHLDKFFGYFLLEKEDGSKYITDKNMSNGKYIELVKISPTGEITYSRNCSFGKLTSLAVWLKFKNCV